VRRTRGVESDGANEHGVLLNRFTFLLRFRCAPEHTIFLVVHRWEIRWEERQTQVKYHRKRLSFASATIRSLIVFGLAGTSRFALGGPITVVNTPFTGTLSESFESFPVGPMNGTFYAPYLGYDIGPMFGGGAEAYTFPNGAATIYNTTTSPFSLGGNGNAGVADGSQGLGMPTNSDIGFKFGSSSVFGGYFATSPGESITVTFVGSSAFAFPLDPSTILGTATIPGTFSGALQWIGFESSTPFFGVILNFNDFNGPVGQPFAMDNLQAGQLSTPEPASLTLLGTSCFAVGMYTLRRRRRMAPAT
jgi:hypothetical protein